MFPHSVAYAIDDPILSLIFSSESLGMSPLSGLGELVIDLSRDFVLTEVRGGELTSTTTNPGDPGLSLSSFELTLDLAGLARR